MTPLTESVFAKEALIYTSPSREGGILARSVEVIPEDHPRCFRFSARELIAPISVLNACFDDPDLVLQWVLISVDTREEFRLMGGRVAVLCPQSQADDMGLIVGAQIVFRNAFRE